MSNSNELAKYFKDSEDPFQRIVPGSTFFDIIGEATESSEVEFENEEINWIYDYWHSSELTRQPFINTKVFLNPEFAFTESLEDPIRKLVLKYYGVTEASKRLLPTAAGATLDVAGLEKLIKFGSFRSVVDLTCKILKQISTDKRQFHFSLKIWYLRILMLFKLKLFKEAEIELQQFDSFDKAEYFFESYPDLYPNRKGSMIPFGFRIVKAELGVYLKNSNKSLIELHHLNSAVDKVLEELKHDDKAYQVWSQRKVNVQISTVNILINTQDYEKSIEILRQILESSYSNKCLIWSCISKVLTQIGDLNGASNAFLNAKACSNLNDTNDNCRNLINLGLLHIANGLFQEAFDTFTEASRIKPDNALIINNISLCLFYVGKLREAIKIIEEYIFKNPNKQLNEGLLFNLCTLYELESAKAQQKKFNLLLWLNLYVGDGFYEPSLKLT